MRENADMQVFRRWAHLGLNQDLSRVNLARRSLQVVVGAETA